MNREDIIRMARDCGGSVEVNDTIVAFEIKELEAFANLVAAAEREACAVMINILQKSGIGEEHLVEAIRERGAP